MHIHDQFCVEDFLVIKYSKKKLLVISKSELMILFFQLFARKKELPHNGYLILYTIILQCTWIIGSFPLYVYHFLLYGTPLFGGDVSDVHVATPRLLLCDRTKNLKYPSTCHVTPPQVGHWVTAVYPLLMRIVRVISIPLFKFNGRY